MAAALADAVGPLGAAGCSLPVGGRLRVLVFCDLLEMAIGTEIRGGGVAMHGCAGMLGWLEGGGDLLGLPGMIVG